MWRPKKGRAENQLERLGSLIERGLAEVAQEQETIRTQVKEVQQVYETLDACNGTMQQRQQEFAEHQQRLAASADEVRQKMARVMASFAPGLFVGDEETLPLDNLDLERWFRSPKGHERRIHGRRHAGVRLVQEGATLAVVLDAHQRKVGLFRAAELCPYRRAEAPPAQREAVKRRKIMRKARSRKQRPRLLADLERKYRGISS